jgi:hypothetical protein
VLLLWQGLGYYSRARRLREGARQLLDAGGGDPWPADLPGFRQTCIEYFGAMSCMNIQAL